MSGNVVHFFVDHDVAHILATLQEKHLQKGIRSISVVYCLKGEPQECRSEVHVGIPEDTTTLIACLDYNKHKVIEQLDEFLDSDIVKL